MNFQKNPRSIVIVVMILMAALSRLLPHPPNFTPIGGMALFGAAYFTKKHWAFLVPFLALWISDLVLNNIVYGAYYDGFSWMGMPLVYVAFLLIALMGQGLLKKVQAKNVVLASLIASALFFLVTNLGSWWMNPMYPKSLLGIGEAYLAGLPFFFNTIAGDLFFSGVLFGGFELIQRQYPAFALEH